MSFIKNSIFGTFRDPWSRLETQRLIFKKQKTKPKVTYKFPHVRGALWPLHYFKSFCVKGTHNELQVPRFMWYTGMFVLKDQLGWMALKKQIVIGGKTRTGKKDIWMFHFPPPSILLSFPVLFHIRRGSIASSRIFAAVCFVTLLGKLAVKPRELQWADNHAETKQGNGSFFRLWQLQLAGCGV